MDEFEALLVVERGPTPSRRFPLQLEQITVGRSAGNDLVLADPEISRRHIRVTRRADGFAVEDIGSTNGTFVNGQRISHLTLLQDGDTIDLGDTVRLRFLAQALALPDPPGPPLSPGIDRPTLIGGEPGPVAAPAPLSPAAAVEAPVQPWPAVAPIPAAPPPPPVLAPSLPSAYSEPRRGRGLLLGCGLLVALLLVCAGTFLVLDTYDQGRLLYCGALRPFFEVVLGLLGYAPPCA